MQPVDSFIVRQIELLLRGGNVLRFHTLPTQQKGETVGHHSFYVAWFVQLLSFKPHAPEIPPSVILLMAALTHDLAERITGDLPAPAKRALGIQQQFAAYERDVLKDHGFTDYEQWLQPGELHVLKMADSMAGLLTCVHERTLGNKYITEAAVNFMSYIEKLEPVGFEITVFNELQRRWKHANGE